MKWDQCLENGIPTLRCLPVIYSNLLTFGISMAAVAAVFFITFSGIKFLTSGGDPVKVSEAKKTFTFALIGLIVVVLSFTILKVIGRIIGVDCSILGVEKCK